MLHCTMSDASQAGGSAQFLENVVNNNGCPIFSAHFADLLDSEDNLAQFRDLFIIPKVRDLPNSDSNDSNEDAIYLCGHSLGLQPKRLKGDLLRFLDSWAKKGVYGYYHGELPLLSIDEAARRPIAELVGAFADEVAVMNSLSLNLHLLMISFYRPTADRYKILFEERIFPSDFYAFESQVRLHGYDPKDAFIIMSPRSGEHCLRVEDILQVIEEKGHEIQLICFSGVQYYTGKVFDILTITQAGQKAGAFVGWDLAHAIGNIELHLHDWNVDFAVWCHYKYVCSGASATGGAFLHQKYLHENLPRLQGWWGHHVSSRFEMNKIMDPAPGISGYQISCPPFFSTVPVKISSELILQAGIERLTKKSRLLVGYLDYLLTTELKDAVEIITPRDVKQRGSQLSLRFEDRAKHVFEKLENRGVVCDYQNDVIRVSLKAIYNSFRDVYRFVVHLKDAINE